MKIITLIENGSISSDLRSAHGLSIYIEANDKKILFDLGPNNLYLKNAAKIGVNIEEVDVLVISHGHYDHGFGLGKFMKINKTAQIFISNAGFGKHYKRIKKVHVPIGLKMPKHIDRITFVSSDTSITPEIKLYSNVEYFEQLIGDSSMMKKFEGKYKTDRFDHEIYLTIKEANVNVLFSGCSHKGIENIITTIEKRQKEHFSHVIGGFHLSQYDPQDLRQTIYLEKIGNRLLSDTVVKYFTCHCTGKEAFVALKKQLNANLERIKTGSVINL